MKCGLLSHQGCYKLGFTAKKTFMLGPFISIDVSKAL